MYFDKSDPFRNGTNMQEFLEKPMHSKLHAKLERMQNHLTWENIMGLDSELKNLEMTLNLFLFNQCYIDLFILNMLNSKTINVFLALSPMTLAIS